MWAQGITSIQDYYFTTGVDQSKWITLTSPTTIIGTYSDDNAYGCFPIGFSFLFCGADYTQFSVNTNGNFSLGNIRCGSMSSSPLSSSNSSTNSPKIIGIGRDLATGSNGYIRYQTLGTAPNRILICEFVMAHTYGSSYSANIRWQVQLHESNSQVLIVYNNTPSTIPSYFQIGIANSASDVVTVNPNYHTVSNGSSSSTYSTWPGEGRYYAFLPPNIECGRITRLNASAVGSNSALVEWNIGNATATTQVVLQYDDDPAFNSPQSDTVTGNPPYALTGLNPTTSYHLRASAICDEGVTDLNASTQFTTSPQQCAQYGDTPDTLSIGNGTTTNTYLWGYSYYNYSFTEQIYRQEEFGSAMPLYGMAVQVGNASHPRRISIYLGHTDQSSVDEWILPNDMTLVWSGTTQYTANSWNEITFNAPFPYNGTDNLLLMVIDQTGTYYSNPYNSVHVHTNSGYYSRYVSSDGTSYHASSAPSSTGTSTSYRTNVRWYTRECLSQDQCETPAVMVSDITDQTATVRWAATTPTNYRIYISSANEGPTLVATTSNTTYMLNGMEADTRYTVYVLPDCATSLISSVHASFKTECGETGGCIEYDDLYSCRVECRHGNFDNPDLQVGVVNYGPSSSSSSHTVHINPNETDPRTRNQLHTVPDGYATSVRLGNWETNYGAESIRYRYKVDTTVSDLLILKYAAVLQDPNHTAIEQPRFTFRITDENGEDLDANCYSADFIANSNLGWHTNGSILWKDWTTVGVPLTQFQGQTIYIKLTTYDCNQGGHYGYAYFVIDCGNKNLISSSCGDTEENTYTAPAGFNYRWYSDDDPESTLSTGQSFHVSSAGTYHCELSFVGASNTLCPSVLLTALSGSRYPYSRFSHEIIDTTGCLVNYRFFNNSIITRDLEHNELTTYPCESYLWIFDDGTVSTAINPTHSFSAGTHQVQLVAMLSNGLCTDTSEVTIQIDPLCEPIIVYEERTICENELPYEWNGVQFFETDTQEVSFTTALGNDSVVVMTLTVTLPTHTAVDETACETFTWNGTVYDFSGNYTYSHPDTNNCIQVDTLHLIINHNTIGVDERIVCDSLRWHGNLYTVSVNTPTYHSTNAAGCDSTTTLHLTVHRSSHVIDTRTVCDSLIWHDSTYRSSTNYPTNTSISSEGCDSTTTLHLTVRYSSSGIEEQNVCDSIIWHGSSYTTSTNTPTHLSTNVAGCDSTTTLHLTVRYSSSGIEEHDVCDSYTWHGSSYTTSTNTPTYHRINAAGCDSTTTLHLIVRHSSYGIDTRIVCDSLTWHGNMYTESTSTATFHSTNAAGCDSTTTLNLTVLSSTQTTETLSECDRTTWHGNTYTESGIYVYNFINDEGCPSHDTLRLTIHNSYARHHYDTICEGESIRIGSEEYSTGGNYTAYLSSIYGCDSTVWLHLVVRPRPQVEIAAEYDCPTEYWSLSAITNGEYHTWSTTPQDQQLTGHEHDTIIHLNLEDTILLTLTADYISGLSCPQEVQLTLSPIVNVTAQIECHPDVLKEDQPEIEAWDLSNGNTACQWYVDDMYWGGDPVIGLTVDPTADELVFKLIAYNDYCADTVERILYSVNQTIYTPNVFTPSLSTNSTFRAQGTGILEFQMSIYTREGQLVFRSDNIEDEWDGTHDGEPCPQANYVYYIRYRGRRTPDGWQTLAGSVLLLR